MIRTSRRQLDQSSSLRQTNGNPYEDKVELGKILQARDRTGLKMKDSVPSMDEMRRTSGKESPPSKTYFPSHMQQTLNSLRRQSKGAFEKNVPVY